jgi:hypothetical protein
MWCCHKREFKFEPSSFAKTKICTESLHQTTMDYISELRKYPENALDKIKPTATSVLVDIWNRVPAEDRLGLQCPSRGYDIKQWLINWGTEQQAKEKLQRTASFRASRSFRNGDTPMPLSSPTSTSTHLSSPYASQNVSLNHSTASQRDRQEVKNTARNSDQIGNILHFSPSHTTSATGSSYSQQSSSPPMSASAGGGGGGGYTHARTHSHAHTTQALDGLQASMPFLDAATVVAELPSADQLSESLRALSDSNCTEVCLLYTHTHAYTTAVCFVCYV